jgi:hypothetical protein
MPMPVFNHIQSKVQRIIDFFTRNEPAAFVEPNSKRETDRLAAKVGEQVRQMLWIKNEEDENFDEAACWLVTTGNVFKREYIDVSLKNSARVPKVMQVNEPNVNPMGQPPPSLSGSPTVQRWQIMEDQETAQPIYEEIPQGEVNSYVTGPMSMTLPLAARKPAASPWMMETGLHSLEMLRELYPDKAQYIPKTGTVITSDLYQHRLTSLLTSGLHGVVRSLDPFTMEGFGIVHYYEKAPDRDFPNGLAAVELDGIPLYIGDLPAGMDYSWSHAGYFRVPGRFWFRGAVEDLIQPQEQINKLEQFLELNDAFNSNPKTLVPIESGIAEGSIRNIPGKVIRYKFPFEPKPLPGVDMPPQVIQRRAMYVQEMEEISSVRNVMMGDAPPGVTAGVALNRLGEEAEGMFAPIQRRWEKFIERDQTLKLKLVQRYYNIPRYLAVRREGQLQEVHDFVGSQLKDNVRVKVEAGSYRPRSKAGQQQLMIDALGMGLIPGVFQDPDQMRLFLEKLGVEGFEPAEGLDTKRARWENEMLMRSVGHEQIQRDSADNDMIHLMVHTNNRKTDDYLRLPIHVKQRCILHEVEHIMAIIQFQGQPTDNPVPAEEDIEPASTGGPPGQEEGGPPGQEGEGNAQDQGGSQEPVQ